LKRLLLLASAALAGASGLGLEVVLLSSAGLALGYARSAALGLAAFVAGWALGACASGSLRAHDARAVAAIGVLLAACSYPALRALLWLGDAVAGTFVSQAAALALIALIAALQGAFLPVLARALARIDPRPRDVSLLLACNLAGAVAGAYSIGDLAVGSRGRGVAAACAGCSALGAAFLARIALRGSIEIASRTAAAAGAPSLAPTGASVADRSVLTPLRAGWIVGVTTAWLIGLEWIGLRLGVLWLSGMQPALTAVLCASLVALALGAAAIPRVVPRGERGVVPALCLCALGAAWPVHAATAMRALGSWLRAGDASSAGDPLAWQAALERAPALARACVLVGPSLIAFGGVVPVLHRALSGESGERLGRLYLHEAWGALIGAPLAHFVLVPKLGLAGAAAASMVAGACALAATYRASPRASVAALIAITALAWWTARRVDPALDAPPLAQPAFTLRSFREDREFAVAVVDDGIAGERTLLTDGFRAAGTGAEYRYMRVLGHLPVLLHAAPRRAAVLALGTGTTVGAVSLHREVEHIDVLEISAAVVDAAGWFTEKNRGVLADVHAGDEAARSSRQRVRVLLGDGRFTLASHPGEYDVITMEPLLPDSPFAVYLYTREFYARARRALAPGGLVCQWVPPHALEPATFDAVLDAFARSFQWSSVWLFGTQVILVGAERAPELDARRFEGMSDDLRSALVELGIATPRGLLARLSSVGGLAPERSRDLTDPERSRELTDPERSRELTDDDPWIAYRPRRRGVALLADLPANLRAVRARESDPPPSWLAAAGPGAGVTLAGVRTLHLASEAHAREEARTRGAQIQPSPGDPDCAASLARARKLCPEDPELLELEREIRFLDALRRGVSALSADRSPNGARAALPDLVTATELRAERADVHLYTAAALSLLDSPAATKALDAALERCPRIAETSEGRRARALGLADALWQRAQSRAGEAADGAR
jgi:spermidine synthase